MPVSSELENLKDQYLEAIRLHLWYKGSPFSYHQSKTSKELSGRYLRIAHEHYFEYLKTKQGRANGSHHT